jgi:hypothetical protein
VRAESGGTGAGESRDDGKVGIRMRRSSHGPGRRAAGQMVCTLESACAERRLKEGDEVPDLFEGEPVVGVGPRAGWRCDISARLFLA